MYTINIQASRVSKPIFTYHSNDIPRIGDALEIGGTIFNPIHGIDWIIDPNYKRVKEVIVCASVNESFPRGSV